jgi:hypothetical protein
MPSLVLGQPYASGAQQVIVGSPWSGQLRPQGQINFWWVCAASGANCYLALSGGGPPASGNFMTYNSGQMFLSGGALSGLLDGCPIAPGGTYNIPRLAFGSEGGTTSGTFNVFAMCDPTASGIGRLYFEVY